VLDVVEQPPRAGRIRDERFTCVKATGSRRYSSSTTCGTGCSWFSFEYSAAKRSTSALSPIERRNVARSRSSSSWISSAMMRRMRG
jgi:hypothetical protein